MKKKNIILIFSTLLISLFLFTACGTRTERPIYSNPRTGTEGLVLQFIPGNPPAHINVGDTFSIQVEVQNRGAYPQDPSTSTDPDSAGQMEGFVVLEGFDTNFFSFEEMTNFNVPAVYLPPTLYGKDQYNPRGTNDFISFNGRIDTLPHGDTEFFQRFQVTACYFYRTIALPTICIDPDPFRTQVKEKVCYYNQVTNLGAGQGGPVSVTYVRPEYSSTKVRYEIGLSNSGNGLLIRPDVYASQCPNADYRAVNYVAVKVYVDTEDVTATCRPGELFGSGEILVRLIDGKGAITCTYMLPDRSMPAYMAPMKIVLSYGYSTTIKGQMSVMPQ